MSSNASRQLDGSLRTADVDSSDEEIVFASIDEEAPTQQENDPAATASEQTAAAPPTWFRGKRDVPRDDQTSNETEPEESPSLAEEAEQSPGEFAPPPLPSVDKKPRIRVARIEEEEKGWVARARDYIVAGVLAGYGFSLFFHALLLLLLSLTMLNIDGIVDNEPINTAFSDAPSEGKNLEFVELPSTQIEVPEVKHQLDSSSNVLPLSKRTVAPSASLPSDISKNIAEMVAKSGKAVTKGSFTAWTIPEDPEPGQDYIIVIQVAVPKNVTRYGVNDLTGYVIGTDNFVTPVGFHDGRRKYKGRSFSKRIYGRFDLDTKQLTIKIMGAAEQVKDTIHIESKLLKESQDLEIVF